MLSAVLWLIGGIHVKGCAEQFILQACGVMEDIEVD